MFRRKGAEEGNQHRLEGPNTNVKVPGDGRVPQSVVGTTRPVKNSERQKGNATGATKHKRLSIRAIILRETQRDPRRQNRRTHVARQ